MTSVRDLVVADDVWISRRATGTRGDDVIGAASQVGVAVDRRAVDRRRLDSGRGGRVHRVDEPDPADARLGVGTSLNVRAA